jgi:TPR repeat protein
MTPDEIKQQIMKSANLSVRAIQEEVDFSDAEYEHNLGISYLYGINVEQNSEKAVKCFQASAEQGVTHALNSLGYVFSTGKGVEQNFEEAVKWYRASAEQGNADGQCNLGWSYANGKGIEQNFEEAVKWYRASAEQGNADGQINLGECYRDGLGVERNLHEAAKWFRAAAEQGHDKAKDNLQALEEATKSSSPAQPPPLPRQDYDSAEQSQDLLPRDPRPKDVANVFWNRQFQLYDKQTDEPIFPKRNNGIKVFEIYYSSNEEKWPRNGVFNENQLEGLLQYKFKTLKSCELFCKGSPASSQKKKGFFGIFGS